LILHVYGNGAPGKKAQTQKFTRSYKTITG